MVFLETIFEEVTFCSKHSLHLSCDREGDFLTRAPGVWLGLLWQPQCQMYSRQSSRERRDLAARLVGTMD